MNLNLMVFIQEIIYLKQRVGAYINRKALGSFACEC